MATQDYININIADELAKEAKKLLDNEEEYDPEEAVISALNDKHYWDADTLGILYSYGNMERLKETPVYQAAVEDCVADVAESLEG